MPGQQNPNGTPKGMAPFAGAGLDPRQEMAGKRMMPQEPEPMSPEAQMSEYITQMQEAQKRERMMKMAAMVQGMGQAPQAAPAGGAGASPFVPQGGQPGYGQGGAPNPGQQLQAMLGKAGGIGRIPGSPGAPMGYPGGVPGAAAGAGASPANLLQQLQMRRQGPRSY